MTSEFNRIGRKLDLYEIVQLLEKTTKRQERIDILKKYDHPAIRDYFQCIFDDRVQFLLPEGKPPYKPCRPESAPNTWYTQNKKLGNFVKGLKGDNIIPMRREMIFIGILESIHPEDALLLVSMVSKKSPVKGITKKLINEAFPELIP